MSGQDIDNSIRAPSRPVAIVTGGVKRVGLAIGCALARSGCDLIVTYRSSRAAAEAAAKQIGRCAASAVVPAMSEAAAPRVEIRELDLDLVDARFDLARLSFDGVKARKEIPLFVLQ